MRGSLRALTILVLVVAVATAVAAAILFVTFPAAAAAVCPGCYGFDRAEGRVYIDRAADADQRATAQEAIGAAETRVRTFYGTLESDPRILICTSEQCYRRIGGGGSKGMALSTMALALSPRGLTPVIAAHERAHVELHARLGAFGTWRRDIPQWFDEGLAVVISDDPRYLAPAGTADRCLVAPDGPMPVRRAAWVENAENRQLYAKAACAVSRWIVGHGGPPAVVHMVDRVAAGTVFDTAYAASAD